ncbi:MAG: sodium:proton antiporter [Spirochaetes bacterium]|nr:MAG: sodium:proton antiporter [Spirochaetota bacterium]
MNRSAIAICALLLVLSIIPSIAAAQGTGTSLTTTGIDGARAAGAEIRSHDGNRDLGSMLPLWSVIPFIGILLSIALFPLLAPHFWERHFAKVSAFWALIFAAPFLAAYGLPALDKIIHIYVIDYIPFIVLLWSLYTIAGGIHVKGSLKGSPAVNSVILLAGALLASWIGTTGASMLLIRPLLRSNAWRKHRAHTVVFFIFLVGNIGGSLTPLGDPPLFLGFLHGVPFFWTLKLLPHAALATGLVLAVYYALDTFYYRKEDTLRSAEKEREPLAVEGAHNFIFLGGVVGAVLFSGMFQEQMGSVSVFPGAVSQSWANLVRDAALVLFGCLSILTTNREIRRRNEFSWGPMTEVAWLFAGIFMTIIPAIAILLAGEHGALAFLIKSVDTPAHYFWAAGGLSSFLDNAPTYLTFYNTALGKFYAGMPEPQAVTLLIAEKAQYLAAISAGAVFMGANTYIGNAPNFMVKSIAESAGVRMPSFFGYMFKYSIPVLVVVFIIITIIFF